jgi:hypothetical protein
VDDANPKYASAGGVLFNKEKTKLIAFPAGIEGSYTIPAYVEMIGFGAFENTKLSEITFAENINLLTIVEFDPTFSFDAFTHVSPSNIQRIFPRHRENRIHHSLLYP